MPPRKPSRSPLAPSERKRLRAARARAPQHPAAPESRMRHAMVQLFRDFHRQAMRAVLDVAPAHAEHRKHQRGDSDETPSRPRHSVFESLWTSALMLLHQSPYSRMIAEAAAKTGDSATAQTKKAVAAEELDPDYSGDVAAFSDRVMKGTADFLDRDLECMEDVLQGWDGEDIDELEDQLGEKQAGTSGSAVSWIEMAFAELFANTVRTAQLEAGVGRGTWLSQRDSHVRPAHLALDGIEHDLDEKLLKAEDADKGEDCFEGSDYNCRCVCSLSLPDEEQ